MEESDVKEVGRARLVGLQELHMVYSEIQSHLGSGAEDQQELSYACSGYCEIGAMDDREVESSQPGARQS